MAFGPIQKFSQHVPIWLLAQIRTVRLGARNDCGIEPGVPKIVKVLIEVVEMFPAAFASRNPGQRIKFDANRNVARCGFEKFEELHFCVFECRVWHVIYEGDFDVVGTASVTVDR